MRTAHLASAVGWTLLLTATAGRATESDATLERTVRPFLAKTCVACHNSRLTSGSINLESLAAAGEIEEHRADWERVLRKLSAGEMPPPGTPRPAADTVHAENFAYFLGKLKSTPDGDGSLLDHSFVVYGSGLSDPNAHSRINLPTVLAGRANGQLKPGRHVTYPSGTPMSNLVMTLLSCMDVRPESFGDSTGKLQYLTDL